MDPASSGREASSDAADTPVTFHLEPLDVDAHVERAPAGSLAQALETPAAPTPAQPLAAPASGHQMPAPTTSTPKRADTAPGIGPTQLEQALAACSPASKPVAPATVSPMPPPLALPDDAVEPPRIEEPTPSLGPPASQPLLTTGPAVVDEPTVEVRTKPPLDLASLATTSMTVIDDPVRPEPTLRHEVVAPIQTPAPDVAPGAPVLDGGPTVPSTSDAAGSTAPNLGERPTRERSEPAVSKPGVDANEGPRRLAMFPLRFLAVLAFLAALALSAAQAVRVVEGQTRLLAFTSGALLAVAIGAICVVAWTWMVTENVRRLLSPARTQQPPSPTHAALTWVVPLTFLIGAWLAFAYLSGRLNDPTDGTESALPLGVALGAVILLVPLMYWPVNYLNAVVRKIGGHGVSLAILFWLPVALSVAGGAVIFGLRVGGAFGEDYEGIAPPWVLGIAALVPSVVLLLLAWRAGAAVEDDVERAYDRRQGTDSSTTRRASRLAALYAEGGPDQDALRKRGVISQVPGSKLLAVAVTATLAGLALVSLVGCIVMVMFWQSNNGGAAPEAESDRVWALLQRLQGIERIIGVLAVIAVMLWTAVSVLNIRFASARRRNPLVAALSWPAAAFAVWWIADRFIVDGSTARTVLGFVAQALVVGVPYFLLFRASGSIGARRQAIRIAWALNVVLLVHVQGLGGLSNASESVDSAQIARLAGYLGVGALLALLTTFAAAAVMRAMLDATASVVHRHNSMVDTRRAVASEPGAPVG